MVQTLIAAGADVNQATTEEGNTPLHVATHQGHTEIVAMLLQHGADKSIRGFNNETSLEAAQRNNHRDTIALLLKQEVSFIDHLLRFRVFLTLAALVVTTLLC